MSAKLTLEEIKSVPKLSLGKRKEEVPACVQACPTRALIYGEADSFSADIRKAAAGLLARAAE